MSTDATGTTERRYEGRTAIVTGAASGIGRAIAGAVVAEGGTVVATDIDADGLARLDADRLVTVAGDVADPSLPHRLLDTALAAGDGRIDALFNNAGIGSATPTVELADAEWRRVMDVNVDAVFRIARDVGAVMVRQGHGAILNTASVAGTFGLPGRVAYSTSKHAVVGMTKSLATEWGVHGIRVNALCPGLTETGFNAMLRTGTADGYWEKRKALVPMRRASQPEEQAEFALFMNSDRASYASGMILEVDGGSHALYSGYAVQRPQHQ